MIGHRRLATGGDEDSGQSAPWGGGIGAQPVCGCRVATRPRAMQCVDTASTSLRQTAKDAWRLAPGLCPAATSPAETAVPPQAMWMLKRHSALVRVIVAGSAVQRLCLPRR